MGALGRRSVLRGTEPVESRFREHEGFHGDAAPKAGRASGYGIPRGVAATDGAGAHAGTGTAASFLLGSVYSVGRRVLSWKRGSGVANQNAGHKHQRTAEPDLQRC